MNTNKEIILEDDIDNYIESSLSEVFWLTINETISKIEDITWQNIRYNPVNNIDYNSDNLEKSA